MRKLRFNSNHNDMLEIEYSITTSEEYLENIAREFCNIYGKKVDVRNNALIFPHSLAKGRFEFHRLDEGMSMNILDCCFYEDVRFINHPVKINYFHTLSFNLTTISFMTNKHEGKEVLHVGNSWKNKILYSTSEKGFWWIAPRNANIRILVVHFTREWLLRNYKIENASKHFPYGKEFLLDMPLQFNLDLNMELLFIAQDIFAGQVPLHMQKLYYGGCAKKLIAHVAHMMAHVLPIGKKPEFNEVAIILSVVERLENELNHPLPLLEDIARECSMSKEKFVGLFKVMYKKNYFNFFQDVKMQKAGELLLSGWKVADVADAIGYNNLSHFIKVFKAFFKITPKLYQEKFKKAENQLLQLAQH